ncbi:MAG: LysM peptidoglycan-binding domain-containing protein [Akkermansia sp.]|nr:LysM peptidoglycan-binding domain-containing protein [Akkermansia sp.]
MKKTLLTLAAGAGILAVIPSCTSSNTAYPGGEEEAVMMSDATDPGVIPPWASEEDFQVPAGGTTHDRNNYAIPEGPVAGGGSSQHQPAAATGGGSSQHQPDAANTAALAGNDVLVENEPLTNLDSPVPPVEHTSAGSSSGRKGGKKGGKAQRRISPAKPSIVTYKVRPGDNLTVIAQRSNTTVEQIRKDSNIKGDVIRPGQIIKVRYTPKGYKASTGGKKGGASTSSGGSSKTVTVKKGESLSSIAAKNGVTVQQLKDHNGIKGSTIMAGQKISIPGKASTTTKKSSSKKKSNRRKR